MKFQREVANESLFNDMAPLWVEHWSELINDPGDPLKPNLDQYLALEAAGMLRAFTARDDDGELIGYAVYFVTRSGHSMELLRAVSDVVFILRERRGFGGEFLKWTEGELAHEGVGVIGQHVRATHNFGPMLERMGYELVELIYQRRI